MARMGDMELRLKVVPELDEEALAEFRARFREAIRQPHAVRVMPPDPLTIRLPDQMGSGTHRLARLIVGEWSEVLPGLQVMLSQAVDDVARGSLMLEMRLTPQEPEHVPAGFKVTSARCPGCDADVPIDTGDLAGLGFTGPDDIIAEVQRLVEIGCPAHSGYVRIGKPQTRPGGC